MTTEFIEHQDWTTWLAPLSEEAPCGPDLEYDTQFRELEEAATGRPDAEYGDTLVAAVPPDWELADTLSTALMARTRDLRVVMYLARARWAREGVTGLLDGLALTAALLEDYWDHVHPQLDASEGDDATARISALAAWTNAGSTLAGLLDSPLPHRGSPVTLREWSYANGDSAAPEGHTAMSVTEIEAAVRAAPDESRRVKTAFDTALNSVCAIEAVLSERIGATASLDLGTLKALLQRASALLQAGLGEQTVEPGADQSEATSSVAVAVTHAAIASRADVAAALERICAWYAHHEPGSPVPLLLGRARNLIDKTFVDLLKDLAPDGLAQLTQVVGAASVDTAKQ
jgi:type VI secretion system protein ImpA